MGDYAAAIRTARDDWQADTTLQWPRETIAWLLIKMMKGDANAYSKHRFVQEMLDFKALDIPKDNHKLWGAIAWPIRDILEDSMRMEWFTPQLGDELFDIMRVFPFDRPSESYSALAKAFAAVGAKWPRLAEMLEWWGLENLTAYDYRRYPENGKLTSTAEKVLTAYMTGLHRYGDGKPSEGFYEAMKRIELRV